MRENPKKKMILSQKPNGEVLVTVVDAEKMRAPGESDADLAAMGRACADAVATEVLPMTEAAYADFAARHGGRLLYPTLAAYPAPRR
jgi:hypothetical protein